MTGWWKGMLLLGALAFFTWALATFMDAQNIQNLEETRAKQDISRQHGRERASPGRISPWPNGG